MAIIEHTGANLLSLMNLKPKEEIDIFTSPINQDFLNFAAAPSVVITENSGVYTAEFDGIRPISGRLTIISIYYGEYLLRIEDILNLPQITEISIGYVTNSEKFEFTTHLDIASGTYFYCVYRDSTREIGKVRGLKTFSYYQLNIEAPEIPPLLEVKNLRITSPTLVGDDINGIGYLNIPETNETTFTLTWDAFQEGTYTDARNSRSYYNDRPATQYQTAVYMFTSYEGKSPNRLYPPIYDVPDSSGFWEFKGYYYDNTAQITVIKGTYVGFWAGHVN